MSESPGTRERPFLPSVPAFLCTVHLFLLDEKPMAERPMGWPARVGKYLPLFSSGKHYSIAEHSYYGHRIRSYNHPLP